MEVSKTEHECCNCINGEFIEVDIDIWDWTCMYCYQQDDEDCDENYQDDESM